jgi:hypothetical protein
MKTKLLPLLPLTALAIAAFGNLSFGVRSNRGSAHAHANPDGASDAQMRDEARAEERGGKAEIISEEIRPTAAQHSCPAAPAVAYLRKIDIHP